MRRTGRAASALLTTLCAGGILTLFSQASWMQEAASGPSASSAGTTAMDPGEARSPIWSGIVPASLEKGAAIQLGQPASGRGASGQAPGTRLRLR